MRPNRALSPPKAPPESAHALRLSVFFCKAGNSTRAWGGAGRGIKTQGAFGRRLAINGFPSKLLSASTIDG